MKTCPECSGDGVIEKGTDNEQQCPTCGGSGFAPDDENNDEVLNSQRLAVQCAGPP
jgi:DnaJ-class molecular chaperone